MLRFILIRSKSQKYCVYAYAAKPKCVPYALTTYYALQLQRMNGSHAPHHLHKLSPKTRKYIKGSTVIKIKGNSVESAWFSMEISLKTQKGAAWKCDTREKQSFPYCCFPCKSKQNMPAFSLGFPSIQAYPVYPCQQGLLTTLATFLLLSGLRLPRLFAASPLNVESIKLTTCNFMLHLANNICRNYWQSLQFGKNCLRNYGKLLACQKVK